MYYNLFKTRPMRPIGSPFLTANDTNFSLRRHLSAVCCLSYVTISSPLHNFHISAKNSHFSMRFLGSPFSSKQAFELSPSCVTTTLKMLSRNICMHVLFHILTFLSSITNCEQKVSVQLYTANNEACRRSLLGIKKRH